MGTCTKGKSMGVDAGYGGAGEIGVKGIGIH